MRRALTRIYRIPRIPQCAPYATAAAMGKTKAKAQIPNVAAELEKEGDRLLRVVRGKMAERDRLLQEQGSEHETSASTSAAIQRAKTLKELEPLHHAWQTWQRSMQSLRETQEMMQDNSDPDLRQLAVEEHDSLSSSLSSQLSETIPSLLIPPSQTSSFGTLMDLKAGVGGDEACLFLAEMLRMYTRLAQVNGFIVETMSVTQIEGSKGASGGIKDAILEIRGEGSYDMFRWESGVHRVQRIPATETQGRVHTSAVAVVVLPSAPDSQDPSEVDIVDPKDVRTEVMRSRGAGGQHVNKTESAVRLTHEPTGITVSMQDSRSQHQNRAKAWQVLRARLLDRKLLEEQSARRSARRDLVRGSDRSDKIRTYNYPQDRITDHRINYSINNLAGALEGEGLEVIIHELRRDHEISIIEDLLTKEEET